MNAEDFSRLGRRLKKYRVQAMGITIKGKNAEGISFHVFRADLRNVHEMCLEERWHWHTTHDQFINTSCIRVQLVMNGIDPRGES